MWMVAIAAAAASTSHVQAQSSSSGYNTVVCPSDSSVVGYVNTTLLNEDILKDVATVIETRELKESYVYTLCPQTTYEIDNFSDPAGTPTRNYPIIPVLPITYIRCGMNGSSEDSCVMKGGTFHFFFSNEVDTTQNVIVSGFTFEGALGTSLFGNSPPTSYAFFLDCLWKDHQGDFTAALFYTAPESRRRLKGVDGPSSSDSVLVRSLASSSKSISILENHNNNNKKSDSISKKNFSKMKNQMAKHSQTISKMGLVSNEPSSSNDSPNFMEHHNKYRQLRDIHFQKKRELQDDVNYAMAVYFNEVSFENNNNDNGAVFTVGGVLHFLDSDFKSNISPELAIINALGNGHLSIESNTQFVNNKGRLGPVYVDSTSFLRLADETISGTGNEGIQNCDNGIFMEYQPEVTMGAAKTNCTFSSQVCFGNCCAFGNKKCDIMTDAPSTVPPTTGTIGTIGGTPSSSTDDEEGSEGGVVPPAQSTSAAAANVNLDNFFMNLLFVALPCAVYTYIAI